MPLMTSGEERADGERGSCLLSSPLLSSRLVLVQAQHLSSSEQTKWTPCASG